VYASAATLDKEDREIKALRFGMQICAMGKTGRFSVRIFVISAVVALLLAVAGQAVAQKTLPGTPPQPLELVPPGDAPTAPPVPTPPMTSPPVPGPAVPLTGSQLNGPEFNGPQFSGPRSTGPQLNSLPSSNNPYAPSADYQTAPSSSQPVPNFSQLPPGYAQPAHSYGMPNSPASMHANDQPPEISPNNPDRWRYVNHNGGWWYYTPTKQWMYWSEGRWVQYVRAAYSTAPQPAPPPTAAPAAVYVQPPVVYARPPVSIGIGFGPAFYPYGPYPYGPYPYGYRYGYPGYYGYRRFR
jgi:hypothetical protein